MTEASILTILLFFIYTWGLGFTATAFLKKSHNFFERNLMRIGIGLGILPILGLVLNFLKIPLDWKIFLLISMAYPVFVLAKKIIRKELPKIEGLKLTKANICLIIVFLLFFATFYMYASGAFKYPWFEDDDPWSHAAGVRYVAIEKTVTPGENNPGTDYFLPYLGPYPPAYDLVLGVLHQTSPYIMWTMKFFNALIISLGIIFFYFFAKRFMKNSGKALFATFILAAIPCFLSHFIWAHALIPALFFVLIYCIDSIFQDKRYTIISSLILASLLVTQPGQAIKIGIFVALYIIVKSVSNRKFLMNFIYIYIPAGILSLTWWGTQAKEIFAMRGAGEILQGAGAAISKPLLQRIWELIVKFFPASSGTATRVYTFDDFFVAKSQNMINNPVGVGSIIYLLLFVFMLLMFIYIVQKTLKTAREQRTLFYALIIINFLAGIVMLLLSVRYITALFGSPIFISLLLDLYAMLLIALAFGILYLTGKLKNREDWIMVVLLWLLFTFLGINSMTFNLPVGLMAFRFWMLFAIPAALIAAEGAWVLSSIMKKFKIPRIAVLVALAVMIIFTSGIPKYQVNTAMWGPGATLSATGQTTDYVWLKTLPLNTRVFTFDEHHRYRVIALNKDTCEWCPHIIELHKNVINMSIDDIYSKLKSEKYEYAIAGVIHVQMYGKAAEEQINELIASEYFTPVYQTQTSVILKIK